MIHRWLRSVKESLLRFQRINMKLNWSLLARKMTNVRNKFLNELFDISNVIVLEL